MTSRLFARLERLQPQNLHSMVVYREEGDTDEDVHRKVLAAGRPVFVMPRKCLTDEEWMAKYAPTVGNT